MSQEQPPIRSRRELRQARDAHRAPASNGTEQLLPAVDRPRQAAPPAEQTHTQRSSQIRARDRAALRTIKELEEKEGQLATGSGPTRRQLRLQQLKEQTLTAANQIVAPARSQPPSSPPAAAQPTDAVQSEDAAQPDHKRAPQDRPSAGAPASEGMTVEQALAARALIAEQARNQIAKMEHIASRDPEAVDPAILAEQIALAERAAVMNRRAMARQKLAEQTAAPAPAAKEPGQKQSVPPENGALRPGPSTANNLAMVTPLEFVKVPGVDRPIMKPPATSHVPVTTRPGSRIPGSKGPGSRIPVPEVPGSQQRPPVGAPAGSQGGEGRSQVIARAEAAARAASRPRPVAVPENQAGDLFEDLPRIPARSAYGLEPLDAATAGLARAQRNRILQFSVLIFGIMALIAGIILIISGISG